MQSEGTRMVKQVKSQIAKVKASKIANCKSEIAYLTALLKGDIKIINDNLQKTKNSDLKIRKIDFRKHARHVRKVNENDSKAKAHKW